MGIRRSPALVLASLLYSCTVPITDWSYTVTAPDGHSRVLIRVLGLKPHRLEVKIESAGRVPTVFTRDYSEIYVGFCEVHWTPDSNMVEIFVTNPVEASYSGDVILGYDVAKNQELDPAKVAGDLRRSIVEKYELANLGRSVDPLHWAHTTDAEALFHEWGRKLVRQ